MLDFATPVDFLIALFFLRGVFAFVGDLRQGRTKLNRFLEARRVHRAMKRNDTWEFMEDDK